MMLHEWNLCASRRLGWLLDACPVPCAGWLGRTELLNSDSQAPWQGPGVFSHLSPWYSLLGSCVRLVAFFPPHR